MCLTEGHASCCESPRTASHLDLQRRRGSGKAAWRKWCLIWVLKDEEEFVLLENEETNKAKVILLKPFIFFWLIRKCHLFQHLDPSKDLSKFRWTLMCTFHSAPGCALWKVTLPGNLFTFLWKGVSFSLSSEYWGHIQGLTMTPAAMGVSNVTTIVWDTKFTWENEDNLRELGKGSFQSCRQGQREMR